MEGGGDATESVARSRRAPEEHGGQTKAAIGVARRCQGSCCRAVEALRAEFYNRNTTTLPAVLLILSP